MLDDLLDIICDNPFIVIASAILIPLAIVLWYEDRYPCIKYKAVWQKEWTEYRNIEHDCGQGCHFSTIMPVVHPAHWEQVCMQRGEKKLGDVRAPYAEIPALPLEK